MTSSLMLAAALAAASLGAQTASPPAETVATVESTAPVAPAKLIMPKGTMVRLMVTKEVNSRDNHAGDRFALRVDEDVRIGRVTIVPIGTKGYGEVVDSEGSGAVGKSGKLNARLLYLDLNGRHIELDGDRHSAGSGGTGQVVGGVVAFGVFGLLMKGNNASLKAGEILNGYTLSDAEFDIPGPAQ